MKTYCFNEQTSKFEASYSSHVLDVKAILSSLCCTCSTKRFSGCFYPPPKKNADKLLYIAFFDFESLEDSRQPQDGRQSKSRKMTHERGQGELFTVLCALQPHRRIFHICL